VRVLTKHTSPKYPDVCVSEKQHREHLLGSTLAKEGCWVLLALCGPCMPENGFELDANNVMQV
jgi:hypothetical protein